MSLRPSERMGIRQKGYKASMDAAEGRRRREDITVILRKADRDRALKEKRRRPTATAAAEGLPQAAHSSAIEKKVRFGVGVRGLGAWVGAFRRGIFSWFFLIIFAVCVCEVGEPADDGAGVVLG